MSKEIDTSTRSMSRLLRDDHHMKAYRRSTGQKLGTSKRLLQWHAINVHERILLIDETNFIAEEDFNKQNEKIIA